MKGDLDLHVFLGLTQGHAGFESITATVSIDADASQEQLDELHTRVLSSSPVGHTLRTAVPVEITLA